MAELDPGRSGPFQYLMQTIQEGWRTLRDEHLLDALLSRLRAAFRNGLVLYLLSLLFLSVATSAGRMVVVEFSQYHDDLRRELDATLQGQHEANREDKHFGVLAALLREVNSGKTSEVDLCPKDQVGCQHMESFLQLFQQLSEAALRDRNKEHASRKGPAVVMADQWSSQLDLPYAQEADEAVSQAAQKMRKILPASMMALAMEGWHTRTARNLQAYWSQERHLPLELCRPESGARHPQDPRHDDDFGPALCEQKDWEPRLSRLFIPSLENLGAPVPRERPPAFRDVWVKERVQQAYWLSRLLDDALAPVVPDKCAITGAETYSFAQAYFISPDSLMRLWQCGPEKVPATLFARTRTWMSASYFQELIRSESDEYDTAAYFDYGGLGLIRTRCRRIVRTQERAGQEPEEMLMGIVCADYTVPLRSFEKELAGSRLLAVDRVDARLVEDGKFSLDSVDFRPVIGDGNGLLHRDDSTEKARRTALIHALNKKLKGTETRDDTTALVQALGRQITRLPADVDGPTSYFVPLGSESGRLQGLLITPRIQYPDVGGPALVTVICLTCSGLLLVMGQTRSRREQESKIITDLLKNLEVGIVIVNEREEIEAANDRGEDVLGVLLPKIGRLRLDRALRPQALPGEEGVQHGFLNLIEPEIVCVNEQGRPKDRKERYQDIIPEQRRNQDSSTYYAKLRMGLCAGQWVRISASPITLPPSFWRRREAASPPRTFGIVGLVRKNSQTEDFLNGVGTQPEKGRSAPTNKENEGDEE